MDSERRHALYKKDLSDWTDGEVIEVLTDRYKPTEVPPCRVCGGPLSIQSIGGGPTKWAHSHDDKGEYLRAADGGIDWEHYRQSEFVDHRCDGDELVIDLIRRFRSAGVSVETMRSGAE